MPRYGYTRIFRKKLRNDYRVLQRIAKVAKLSPEVYGEVRLKDYKLNINGQKFNTDNLHLLPKELSPHAVYTPRSESALVFFTRNSPYSNHFPSDFKLDGMSFSCMSNTLRFKEPTFPATNLWLEGPWNKRTPPSIN